MDLNLLAREDNYRKLNEELEKQTRALMDELESATRKINMPKEDRSLTKGDGDYNMTVDGINKMRTQVASTTILATRRATASIDETTLIDENTRGTIDNVDAEVDIEVDALETSLSPREEQNQGRSSPPASSNRCADHVVRVLTTKMKLLQKEHKDLQESYVSKLNECRDLQAQLKKNTENADGLTRSLKSASLVKERIETTLATANKKIEEVEKENRSLKKEIESMAVEIKRLRMSKCNEVRLNRSLEEAANLRSSLKKVIESQKNLKDEARRREEQLNRSLSTAEKQKRDLVRAFRKQLVLIGNMKKQTSLKEVSNLAKFSEANFLKLLETTLRKS